MASCAPYTIRHQLKQKQNNKTKQIGILLSRNDA